MARCVSYVSEAKLVSMAKGNLLLAVIDVRDEERSYQAHIAGSHHFASGSFAARLPELVRATSGKDTLVFHCALSKVRGPSCARMYLDYLSASKEDSGIKNIMVLERGFNGWEISGQYFSILSWLIISAELVLGAAAPSTRPSASSVSSGDGGCAVLTNFNGGKTGERPTRPSRNYPGDVVYTVGSYYCTLPQCDADERNCS